MYLKFKLMVIFGYYTKKTSFFSQYKIKATLNNYKKQIRPSKSEVYLLKSKSKNMIFIIKKTS